MASVCAYRSVSCSANGGSSKKLRSGLAHELKFGPVWNAIWFRYTEQELPTEALEKWPAIPKYLQRYMEAFIQLTPMRYTDQGMPQRLQLHQIFDWLTLKGIDDRDAVDEFAYYIGALDEEYLKYAYRRIEADRQMSMAKGKRR